MGLLPSLSIPHTSSTLTVRFFADGQGWQGGTDESWGIDNLEVIVNTVSTPDPGSTLALLGLGSAGVASLQRKLRAN